MQQFYTVEQIGKTLERTPEGFLLCRSVPIARTGMQVYGAGETEITPNGDGLVYIQRDAEEVFRPETIASFNGKPVLNDHPDDNRPVDPETWQRLAVGVVLNPRRGVGVDDNYLYADLLITEAEAIADVLAGKREVSCGYGADWEETSAGHGVQKNIVGNHVALVNKARCGGRCSIGDKQTEKEGVTMKRWERIVQTVKDSLGAAFKPEHEKPLRDSLLKIVTDAEEDGPEHHVHIHPPEGERTKFTDAELEKRFSAYDSRHAAHDSAIEELRQKVGGRTGADSEEEMRKKAEDEAAKMIEGELKEEAPPGTGDAAIKVAKDSALFEPSFTDTMAVAEILVPGVQLLTFDKARKPVDTFKDVCNFRKRTLILAAKDQATAALMQQLRRGRSIEDSTIQALTCGQVRDMFFSLGEFKKQANNTAGRNNNVVTAAGVSTSVRGKVKSIADINAANRERYKGGSN